MHGTQVAPVRTALNPPLTSDIRHPVSLGFISRMPRAIRVPVCLDRSCTVRHHLRPNSEKPGLFPSGPVPNPLLHPTTSPPHLTVKRLPAEQYNIGLWTSPITAGRVQSLPAWSCVVCGLSCRLCSANRPGFGLIGCDESCACGGEVEWRS